MNDLELRTALHRDAELVGEPSPDLLDQLLRRRQHQRRQRTALVGAVAAVVLVAAGVPVGVSLAARSAPAPATRPVAPSEGRGTTPTTPPQTPPPATPTSAAPTSTAPTTSTTVVPTSPDAGYTGPQTLSLDGFGAAFSWGATRADAEAALGEQFVTQDAGNGCQQASLPGVPGVVFGIQDGRVVVAAVMRVPSRPDATTSVVTDTGLHIGDPVSRALQAYPTLVVRASGSDAYSTELVHVTGGREVQLISNGTTLAPPDRTTLARQTIDDMQFGLVGSVGEAPCA
jgi:hypothetical protein